MLQRFQRIIGRYGWRIIFVMLSRIWWLMNAFYHNLSFHWLTLTTKGNKGQGVGWGAAIRVSPGCELNMGNNVFVGDRCIFEISINPSASVTIGSDTWVSHDCHIASCNKVHIGQHVLIGEFVSIRDTTHSYRDTTTPMKQQQDIVGQIIIEDDVWIGRGSLIMGRPEGILIGKGSVIGANSVVSKSVLPYAVVAGAPLKHIRSRLETQ